MWSGNYLAGKIALRHLDPLSLASFRMEFAAALMLPIFFAKGGKLPVRARDLWVFIYLAFCFLPSQ
jgi:drug/metabolite transporter (DMT)-like permease